MITIDTTPKEAVVQHRNICIAGNTTCIYTDGSGIDGHVGSAAVILLVPSIQNSAIIHERTYYIGHFKKKETKRRKAYPQRVCMGL